MPSLTQLKSKVTERADIISEKEIAAENQDNDDKPIMASDKYDKSLTTEEDKEALDKVIEQFKADARSIESTILKNEFVLTDRTIAFKLLGEMQDERFQKMKPELKGLLKNLLKVNLLEITSMMVKEADTKPKLYTSTEKFNYLKKKSAILAEMQQRFGLETDF